MYTLTIIGGGAIACGYDSPDSNDVLTHMHAALTHPSIKLDAIVEIDPTQREAIRTKWGNGFEILDDLQTALNKYTSDIVIVATPTSTHMSVIDQIFSLYEPKMILCEKPIVANSTEWNSLLDLQAKKSTKIVTNYIRRFDPGLNKLKVFIENNVHEIHHFYGTFTKDFLHNGSHVIDVIHMLMGSVHSIDPIIKQVNDNGTFGEFSIRTKKCSGVVSNIDNNALSLFELTIYTDKAKIEITGPAQEIIIHHIEESPLFKGYKSYSIPETFDKTLNKYAFHTLECIIKMIEDNQLYETIKAEQKDVNELLFRVQEQLTERE